MIDQIELLRSFQNDTQASTAWSDDPGPVAGNNVGIDTVLKHRPDKSKATRSRYPAAEVLQFGDEVCERIGGVNRRRAAGQPGDRGCRQFGLVCPPTVERLTCRTCFLRDRSDTQRFIPERAQLARGCSQDPAINAQVTGPSCS